MKFEPYNYQKSLIREMKESNIYGCFAFPGSGKTVISLDFLYEHRNPTLVVAPLSILYTTWLTEHEKWDFSKNLKINILHGPEKNQNFYKKAGIHLINPEGIPWLVEKITSTRRFPYVNIIIDESPRFKSHTSKRFKALKRIIKSFKRRVILAGNPIPNHYLDLWSQIYLLDQGLRLGRSFWKFRDKYFYPTDYRRFNWELKPGAQEEIIDRISDVCNFLEVNQIEGELRLPQRRIIDISLDMPPDIRKQYKLMEQKLFAELDGEEYTIDAEDGKIVASTKAVALLKCWQIANGFIYEPLYEDKDDPEKITGRKVHNLHNSLIERTKDLVDELQGSPTIITYNFNEDRETLANTFPLAPIAGSGTSPSELQQIEKGWNANKIPILLAHTKKLSHGLNLQYGRGKTILYYSLTYNFDDFDQLIRRLERQGAEFDHVIVFRLIVSGTIHEAIIRNLDRKNSMAKDFLTALKEYKEEKQRPLNAQKMCTTD